VWLIQHLLGPTWNTVPQYGAHIYEDIHLLERVPKRAAHICLGNWEDSYEHLRRVLKWQTLELRRTYLSLLQMFHIVRGIDAIPFDAFFELAACQSTRANHVFEVQYYTPGRGKIVPRNVTLLVGEKLCRVM